MTAAATLNPITEFTRLAEFGLVPSRPLVNPTHAEVSAWLLRCRDEAARLADGALTAASREGDNLRAAEHLSDAQEYLDLVRAVDALRR